MNEAETQTPTKRLSDSGMLALIAFALPLFLWSGFNADFFDVSGESFIIPFAVFLGGPVAFAAAMWAYQHRDAYLGTAAGMMGAFWLSYGMLLWLTHENVVSASAAGDGDLRGFFFAVWAATFGVLWLASIREHWTLGLVGLGTMVMFVLLSIGHYRDATDPLRVGGWVGFITAGVAWYAALADMLNREFKEPVLPTDASWFRRIHFGSQ